MAKTGHPNFDYTCQAMWRGNTHNFHITGNHSGTSFGQTDAQAFMEGTDSPYALCFGPLQSPAISVVESRYYDGQNSAPVFSALYNEDNPAPTPLVPTGLGYSGTPSDQYLPLEVCAMLEAQVGTSSTSKPIYCRKYLRGVGIEAMEGGGNESVFAWTTAGTACATKMGDGSWYGGRVYISPSARQALTSWSILTQVYNHQVPRGRKAPSSSSSTSNSILNTAIQLAKDAAAAAGAASGF